MKRAFIAAAALLVAMAMSVQGALVAEVDTTTLTMADTLRLTLRADGANLAASPQFDGLNKDFEVQSTQSSSQFRSSNGRVDAWTTWTLQLKPRHNGTLSIPAFTLGSEVSNPIAITVRELDPQLRRAVADTVFFETTYAPKRVYVQSQILVTRRLFYASGAQLYGTMPELPQIDGAMVRPLGEPQHSSTLRDGRPYGMIEQRFVIFPERSGDLTIPPASVSGSVSLRGNSYGERRIGIDVSSESIVVPILGVPADYPKGATWLPATHVDVVEDWPDEPQRGLTVGTPSQRTVIARADGNVASAIPPLTGTLPERIKTYPELPSLNETLAASGLVGTRAETMSLVATSPGPATLPAVDVIWWDTVNDALKTASLPARTVDVTGVAASVPRTIVAQAAPLVPASAATATQAPVAQGGASTASPPAWRTLAWSLLCLALIGALCWMVIELRRRRARRRAADPRILEQTAFATFTASCASADARRIRAALDQWLLTHYAVPLSQATSQFLRDTRARDPLNRLNRALYQHADRAALDVAALRTCVQTCRLKRAGPASRSLELPALYPSV